MADSTLRSRLTSWPMWMFMGLLVVGVLAVGSTRDSGPRTQSDRIDRITQRIACPECNGESVYVSQAPASVNIRNEVARKVAAGQLTDDEIVGYIESTFGGRVLLVPRATGFDALVWVLPVVVLVCALSGLVIAFRRWSGQDRGDATAADIELVEKLMRQQSMNSEVEDADDGI